jgi:polysaccharide pyruvyl transferase WcaK-like protein
MGKILVYGWYGHNNVGDELMAEAIRKIFNEHEIKFVSHLKSLDYQWCDILIIGGGSFLSMPLNCDGIVWSRLNEKPIFYVGVGAETEVHLDHQRLLSLAKSVFIRSIPSESFKNICPLAIQIPDLSLALCDFSFSVKNRKNKSLAILPNAEVVPDRESVHWKRAAWEYFKSECSQAIDELIFDGWNITMIPLCVDENRNDEWAAAELAANCVKRNKIKILPSSWMGNMSFQEIKKPFEQHSVVLTQRFHGAPISQATSTPCVVIHHHDKLARVSSDVAKLVPYYGIQKHLIINAVNNAFIPVNHKENQSFIFVKEVIEKYLTY